MIKYVWAGLIVAGVVAGFITGNTEAVSGAVLEGAKEAAALSISMLGVYALWLGVLKIAEDAGLIKSIAKRAERMIALLFTGIKRGSSAVSLITLNIVANMLGMGNAATPFGLKAMQELNRDNPTPGRATDDMCTFLILNTASVQLLPLSIIAVRSAAGSENAADIVLPAFLATLGTAIFGVAIGKLVSRLGPCRR